MKVRAVIRKSEQDGWAQVRQRGSHRQVHHPTKPGTVTIAGSPPADMPAERSTACSTKPA
jgi:predicted RNA binding protein YcfA (HicA-like mRNA interferase family)